MLLVSGDTKDNLPAAILTNFHPGIINNMVQNIEEQLNSNIQFTDNFQAETQNEMSLVSPNIEPMTYEIHLPPTIPTNFHAEHALAHDTPFQNIPSTAITEKFSMSTEALIALDDASIYRLLSSYDTLPVENPTTVQRNNMQQSATVYHNQIQPTNFDPSSIIISGNPTSVSLNTEPMTCAIHLPPTLPTDFHVEQALAPYPPFLDFPNTIITENFPPSTEAQDVLNDASMYRLLSLSDTVPVENSAMLQRNNMQQSITIHHNQIQPMNFEPSSIMIPRNPSSNSQNSKFGMNIDTGTFFTIIKISSHFKISFYLNLKLVQSS